MAPWNLILCSLALLTNKSLGLSVSHRTYSSRMAASLAGQIKNGSQPSSVLVIGEEADVLTPGQMVFGAIPEQDRGNFLLYQIAMGLFRMPELATKENMVRSLGDWIDYFEERHPAFKDVPTYQGFAGDLLHWLMEKFQLTPEDVHNQLRGRTPLMCTSAGVCYSPNDVVCFCCPF
ncbi:uncharacterized protein LOC101900933 isoform X1 [Musca domestica]|uniref:Uncharacterized protein LOC101900933 isoform X1 n=1 Tax=Musca domestica TaxID=7370 RepID=A0A9J7DMJ2_MUSDO|nr:uncharacterized protein LOC101900933 isoform X1 [Musca domestica]XP_011295473.2 uncharacterized protein LOC101900933 isoform X1 [Musca domestica]XP_011295474.2 uncharacterized protein LOC101900933 isoform X1 [Musca domestica]XP_011295475.2 uncharacterized protein LOC101900933 isoform X1 [Musca domestica]XP_019894909.2 uncharacterized protein LOC101900933 isoform X1 [Musca domestica]XP_058975789.1 uncharacterized protein LOC101900933 isoform X1 [Musca domestica]XP_058975790.1 uncharacterize